jgi:flagellar FliL protein
MDARKEGARMAEAEAKTEAKPAKASSGGADGGKGGSKLVLILLAVNSVLLTAVLAMLVLKPGGAAAHGSGEKAEEHAAAEGHAKGEKGEKGKEALPGPTLRLADFVVHLRDGDAERYARVSFEIEVPDEKAKEAVTLRMPQIRDAFLVYLSDRSAEDLRGNEAISRLKGELTHKISEVAPGAPVRSLYITELIVQ